MLLVPRVSLVVLAVLMWSGVLGQAKPPVLKPGLKAPPIKVAEWVKGNPVTRFEKGKFYVVEFWATWCGPCIMAMPHLSKLAQQYKGKVDFIGVSVQEQGNDVPNLVRAFVKKQGDNMAYTVARDTPNGTMFDTWMTASGRSGIPASILINDEGIVVWIGHPMELDPILEQATSGKLDAAQVLQAFENEQRLDELMKECEASTDSVLKLIKANKGGEALTLIDRLDSRIRKEAPGDHIYPVRFKSLRLAVRHQSDPVGVEAEVGKMMGSAEGNFIAFDLIGFASHPERDRTVGLRLIGRMRQALKVDSASWLNWMNLGRDSEALGDEPSSTLRDYENAKKALSMNDKFDASMSEMRARFNKEIDQGIDRAKKKIKASRG